MPVDRFGMLLTFLCSHPVPYDCRITSRFPEAGAILAAEAESFEG